MASERSPEVDLPMVGMTKARAVYSELRRQILTGELIPGHEVNQEAMAARLGVSITPLREALRRLEMEGLVRLKAHRTVIIPPLTREELVELYVIRIELDSLAARLAAEAASDEQAALVSRLARQKPARDPVVQLELNRGFHRAIYSACGNNALVAYLDQLWDRTDRYRLILVKQELDEGPVSPKDHIEIADAIVARKAARAGELMRNHIARSHARIAEAIDSPFDRLATAFAGRQ
ncbi:MAG TPA: GntR family transcriptional regulator [Bauldia sp.]|nr:GntR family transcriptional regulator [Bauldia sp.]